MTVRELIADLGKHPEDLSVVAFSSNPEKWGQIEDLVEFELYVARYAHRFNGTTNPGGGEAKYVVLSTGVRHGLTADRAIRELEGFDPGLAVVFEPYGSSAAHDFVEVAETRPGKFGIVSRKFRDLTDGADFMETVYEEDPENGRPKLLLCGNDRSASA